MTAMKKITVAVSMAALGVAYAFAQAEPEQMSPVKIIATPVRTSIAPKVTDVTATSASVAIAPALLGGALTESEIALGYFEYIDAHQMCIAIYPTPENCLPKKTAMGSTTVMLTDLRPGTTYTVKYKRDNTIRCITTPCPDNSFETPAVEFTTLGNGDTSATTTPVAFRFSRGLALGSRGKDVAYLQQVLIARGYLNVAATGYFGPLTVKALKQYQKENGLSVVGSVGPLTRAILNKDSDGTKTETFEGTITAYSTACFADGICSITVDGKTIVTTRGWSHDTVGKVLGIPDFGSIEGKVGSRAKVYAAKTDDGYTLYGSEDYYVEVLPTVSSKLPAGSMPSGSPSALQGATWEWQKTVKSDGSVVTPNKSGTFFATFGTNGTISGKTDCNSFSGSYTIGSDGIIKFGPFISTLMYCEGSQETVFSGALAKAVHYGLNSDGNLVVTLSGNEGTMYFIKK